MLRLLFVDDVKIYTVMRLDDDKINLRNALDRISDWSVGQVADVNFC